MGLISKLALISMFIISIVCSLDEIMTLWKTQRVITIKNPEKRTGEEDVLFHPIDLIALKSDNKLKSDCSDLRFYDMETEEFYPYWIEGGCDSKDHRIWVKVLLNGIIEQEVLMLYNNDEVEKTSEEVAGYKFIEGKFKFLFEKDCPASTNHQSFSKDDGLNGKFLRGSDIAGNTVYGSGNTTHTHEFIGNNHIKNESSDIYIPAQCWSRDGSRGAAGRNHTHTLNLPETNEAKPDDYLPELILNLCTSNNTMLQKDVIILQHTTKIMFEFESLGIYFDKKIDYLLKGDENSTLYGSTKGNMEGHIHDFIIPNSGNGDIETMVWCDYDGGGPSTSRVTHSHGTDGIRELHSDTTLPPYFSVLPTRKKKDTKSNMFVNEEMLMMATSIPKYGYEIFDPLNGTYPLISNYPGRVGGSEDHFHSYSFYTKGPSHTQGLWEQTNLTDLPGAHKHLIEGNSTVVNIVLPHYTTIFITKKKSLEVVIGFEGNNEKREIERVRKVVSDTLIVIMGVIIIAIIILCFVTCIISCKIGSLGMKKYKKAKLVDATEYFEFETPKSGEFNINKSLFKIKMDEVKIEDKIGEGGGNGVIYKANWKSKVVAFKVFKITVIVGQSGKDNNNVEDFEKEMLITSSINHPNIIRFFGICYQYPRIGVVMEYCENGDLVTYLLQNEDQITNKKKVEFLNEICDGMEYLHDRKIIHRDLKNANVLVDGRLSTKIIDFGLSRVVEENDAKLTRAPEIVLSGNYTNKVDVFSFGIMIWEILNENFFPYGENITFAIELRVANNPEFRPKVNEDDPNFEDIRWLVVVMQNCWSAIPDERPSFSELSALMRKYLLKDFYKSTSSKGAKDKSQERTTNVKSQ